MRLDNLEFQRRRNRIYVRNGLQIASFPNSLIPERPLRRQIYYGYMKKEIQRRLRKGVSFPVCADVISLKELIYLTRVYLLLSIHCPIYRRLVSRR